MNSNNNTVRMNICKYSILEFVEGIFFTLFLEENDYVIEYQFLNNWIDWIPKT